VRELGHVLEKVVLLGRSNVVTLEDLPDNVRHLDRPSVSEFQGDIMPIRELQRRYAAWALTQLGGHKGKAAEKLGIDAKTLWKWLSDGD
jgi:two-component system response regulator HydG